LNCFPILAVIPINPEGDKITRCAAISAQFEAGSVFFPKSASWLDGLKAELLLPGTGNRATSEHAWRCGGAQGMPNAVDPDSELEATLSELSCARIRELRGRWRATFRSDPPKAFGPDLLRRGIAYRLQEQRHGGLSTSVRRQLNRLIKVLTKKRTGRIDLPKHVKSGLVLMRLWKGKSHRVTALPKNDFRVKSESSTRSSGLCSTSGHD
jgi:Protein of unknown function (DUF2924)